VINFLKDLLNYGQRLSQEGRIPDPNSPEEKRYYECPVEGTESKLKLVQEALPVPRRIQKSSNIAPQHLVDTIKYFMGASESDKDTEKARLRKAKFWELFEEDLGVIGKPSLAKKLRGLRTKVEGVRLVLAAKAKSGPSYYHVVPKGCREPKPLTTNPNLNNMEKLGVISDSVVIVPTVGGKPLTELKEVRECWEKFCARDLDSTESFDLLTGERCYPQRLHERIRSIDAPLVSFNEPVFEFEKFKKGANFPVSLETMDSYIAGASWLKDHGQSTVLSKTASELQVGWWPEGCVEHPLLPLLADVLGGWKGTRKAWEQLSALEVSGDQTLFHFGSWRLSRSRLALVNYWSVTAENLVNNLLRFYREWNWLSASVRGTITIGHPVLVLPVNLHEPVFRSVTLGAPYPDALESYLSHHPNPDGPKNTWILSFYSRKNPTMPEFSSEPKVYTLDSPEPKLDLLINEHKNRLSSQKPNGSGPLFESFLYGILLAISGRIEARYHYRRGAKEKGFIANYSRVFQHPNSFFQGQVGKLEIYRQRIEKEMPKGENEDRTLIRCYSELIRNLCFSRPLTVEQQSQRGMGWALGRSFVDELAEYHKQQRRLRKEERCSRNTD
jgi:hypothetical protein